MQTLSEVTALCSWYIAFGGKTEKELSHTKRKVFQNVIVLENFPSKKLLPRNASFRVISLSISFLVARPLKSHALHLCVCILAHNTCSHVCTRVCEQSESRWEH